jgi:branched-chain amino acid transport system permease protein
MAQLLQILLSGLTAGAIYGLVALGFTVVFNATKVANFAHGEFVMMGGLISATLIINLSWSMLPAIFAALVIVTLLAVAMDRVGLQNARQRSVLSFAMITIGFSIAFRGLMQVAVGRDVLFMPAFGVIPDVRMGGFYFGSQNVWVVLALFAISACLSYLFLKTRMGKAMRAASQNPRAATLCGIDCRSMSLIAFAMAGAMGAFAGALVAPIGAAFYEYGLVFSLKGFAAAILGGLGSPVGAVIGGLLIGAIESVAAGYLDSAYKDATTLAILIALLLVWPSGLLGYVEAKRV